MDDRLVEYMEWYWRTMKIVLAIWLVGILAAVGAFFLGRWIIMLALGGV